MTSPAKKQFLEGRLTYISLAITALVVVFQLFGKTFPRDEAEMALQWVDSHWAEIIKFATILLAFYGRIRREWRA